MVSCLLCRRWPGTAVRASADHNQSLSTLVLVATGHLGKSRVGTAGDTRKGCCLGMNPHTTFLVKNWAGLVLCLAGPLAIWTHSKEDTGHGKGLHCRGVSLGAQNLAHSRKSSWASHCALEPQFWRHKCPLGSLARHPDLTLGTGFRKTLSPKTGWGATERETLNSELHTQTGSHVHKAVRGLSPETARWLH